MEKFIILLTLLTRRQTAAGWGIADMNSVEHPRELSRVLRERKYPFKLPVLHAFPLINKMHAGREEKQRRSFSEKRNGRGGGGEGGERRKRRQGVVGRCSVRRLSMHGTQTKQKLWILQGRCTQMHIGAGSACARVYCRYRARISVLNRGAFISSLYFPRFSIYVIYCPPRPSQSSRRVGVPPWFCESTPNPLPPSHTHTFARAHVRICIKRACFLEPTPSKNSALHIPDILFFTCGTVSLYEGQRHEAF